MFKLTLNCFLFFLLLGLGGCKGKSIGKHASDLLICSEIRKSSGLQYSKTITNGKAFIEQNQIMSNKEEISIFLIKYSGVPTGYLSACNLPDEFKKDGAQVIFSGDVYVPKSIESMNINSVFVELTNIDYE